MEKVQAMAEQVEIKAKVVQTEVKALVLRHKKALEERECELLWKVSCCLHLLSATGDVISFHADLILSSSETSNPNVANLATIEEQCFLYFSLRC